MEKKANLHIGFQLKETNQAIAKFFDHEIAEFMQWDLTTVEGIIIGGIFKNYDMNNGNSITAKDLMNFYKIKKAAISKFLSGLETKGCIVMTKDNKDSRYKEIKLTEKGKQYKEKFSECWKMLNASVEKDLTEEEKTTLVNILNKINKNVAIKEDD